MEAHIAPVSNRSIPRFVRERRWWLLLLVVWTVAVAFSLHAQIEQIRQQTTAIAIEGARNMFRMVLLTRNWNASHGGIYVPVTERTQPNPYLNVPHRDVTTTEGVELTMVNPAYMTRLIAEMAESASGAVFRLTSLRPIRPENKPDRWERQALEAFEQGIKETSGIEPSPEGDMLRYMAPLKVQESCLQCHRKQGYQVGDIRGGISVSQRNAPIEAAVQAGWHRVLLSHGLVFILVLVAGWLMLEMLRRRWFELGDKIQELQDAQSQLLQSEKMAAIGQLAAGVAHEINNPVGFVSSNLNSLKNYSEQMIALLERCRSGQASEADFVAADFDYLKEDLADLLRESRDGLGRVTKIVSDLKDFSHVDEAGWQEADLNAGIEATLNVVWHELKYKAEVVRELGELPLVPCIAAQIDQVVMNLLVNAAHAIESRGTIVVRTGHDDAWAWIEVADTGKGMTPAVMQRIFEPFYTTKPVGKGTGLGLSLAYDIVKKHGGRIEVHSEPGQGSTFRVWLPLQGGPAEEQHQK
ncbi:ATP-binding protein [Ferribacterium limneticum]|uniref:ATP-binding protein n=1 Tax=Ferribacterium limneticum TaxID=76259 RepID=UPI001CFB2D0B|nr:ATP-binding protein [Ferribacterium limneticum]UCV29647.1 DUF3365 domain-containing protein [Ferribacterium limneticum]UCV33566.1 DUF3365 domain-containing protein [Ferribacterium limneticum]